MRQAALCTWRENARPFASSEGHAIRVKCAKRRWRPVVVIHKRGSGKCCAQVGAKKDSIRRAILLNVSQMRRVRGKKRRVERLGATFTPDARQELNRQVDAVHM